MIGWLLKLAPLSVWAYILAGGVAVGGVTYWHLHAVSQARKAGIAQDKARSDGVIAKMVTQHSEALGAANAKTDATSAMLERVKQGAQDALRTANEANAKIRAAFAAVVGERNQLRDDLNRAVASGGVEASNDTVENCRSRAHAAGLVLQEALRISAVCAGDSEDLASGVRALQRAWPTVN
jgi:hypothetical protein